MTKQPLAAGPPRNKRAKVIPPPSDTAEPAKVLHLPDLTLFQRPVAPATLKGLEATFRAAEKPSQVSNWYGNAGQHVARVDQIRAANPTIKARAQHLATCTITGSHLRFDLPASVAIKHSPTAFLRTTLSYKEDGLSAHQLSLYLIMILGLPMPPLPTVAESARVAILTVLWALIS